MQLVKVSKLNETSMKWFDCTTRDKLAIFTGCGLIVGRLAELITNTTCFKWFQLQLIREPVKNMSR